MIFPLNICVHRIIIIIIIMIIIIEDLQSEYTKIVEWNRKSLKDKKRH